MSGLKDVIRSAAPGGNIGKPLMLALGALLASGVLFRGGGAGQATSAGSQPTADVGAGGVLGGLGGLLNKLEEGGLSNAANSWVGSGQNQPVLSQVLPGIVDKLTPNGRLPTAAELSQMI
jgi:uncharacterized protein YidB (DUF937 family)